LEPELIVALVMISTVVVGLGLIVHTVRARQKMRELVMRERIAMIEKGLAPPPEVDPARFETMMQPSAKRDPRSARYRSAGILVIGFGAALFVMLTFAAGIPSIAFGVGGGLVVLGIAIFMNGVLITSHTDALAASHKPPSNTST
jgi:hypothetical protein